VVENTQRNYDNLGDTPCSFEQDAPRRAKTEILSDQIGENAFFRQWLAALAAFRDRATSANKKAHGLVVPGALAPANETCINLDLFPSYVNSNVVHALQEIA
jgi:hypothetical protein